MGLTSKFLGFVFLAATVQAHANDGSIAVVDVLGVAPGASGLNSEAKFYGGDTKAFADTLPVTDVLGGKSVAFASPKLAVSVYCGREYDRPTNGEKRTDWMCTFRVTDRKGAYIDGPDEAGDVWKAESGSFQAFAGNATSRVLGIGPAPTNGLLASFYGGNAFYFAEKVPSRLNFDSASYRISLTCSRTYRRPTNGESRSDFKCDVTSQAK